MIKLWTERQPREKLLIGIAAGLVLLLIAAQFIVKPLSAYPGSQKRLLDQAQRDLTVMKEGKIALSGATPQIKESLESGEAQSMITNSAGQKGLTISRRQPNGDSGLTVWLERADSKLLYSWISGLTGRYSISLLGANLNRNDDGTVRAQLTFKMGS